MERMQFDEEIKPLISVVISFYNEEEVLQELSRRLQNVLRSLPVDYELIFVNDASSDRSLELIMEERKKDKNIKALPFKLSELLSEKMLIKHTTRANLIFKILFRG